MNNNYNFNLLKKENPTLYESIDFNILLILKKYNTNMYKYFVSYQASDKSNIYFGSKIYHYLYNLYLSSLTKNDLKELKILNRSIDKLKKGLEFEFLIKISETGAFNIPLMQDSENIVKNAQRIIMRDKEGFYSTNPLIQNQMDNLSVEFDALNSYLINKEKIMNGVRTNISKYLTAKDLLMIVNYLGYGSVREEILNSQSRKKEKQKTKEL